MKKFLATIILSLCFVTQSKADNIKDFKIEGISIGDSALNFFTEELIQKNKANYYNDKTFIPVEIDNHPLFKIYDAIDFLYKRDDRNYKIYGLNGVIDYTNNIQDCYPKMDKIITSLSEQLDYKKKTEKKELIHPIDKSGKSKATRVSFILDKGTAQVTCFDYSNETRFMDHLAVSLKTEEVIHFLRHAYD